MIDPLLFIFWLVAALAVVASGIIVIVGIMFLLEFL